VDGFERRNGNEGVDMSTDHWPPTKKDLEEMEKRMIAALKKQAEESSYCKLCSKWHLTDKKCKSGRKGGRIREK
jgi:hypothetical protein